LFVVDCFPPPGDSYYDRLTPYTSYKPELQQRATQLPLTLRLLLGCGGEYRNMYYERVMDTLYNLDWQKVMWICIAIIALAFVISMNVKYEYSPEYEFHRLVRSGAFFGVIIFLLIVLLPFLFMKCMGSI
jgi:hypothetical protein